MHDQDRPQDCGPPIPGPVPGEFERLLLEIEKEPVPERLLELALKLQAALMERRERYGDERQPDEA